METVNKTFAIIEGGIVANAIVGEALAIVQALLPEATLVEVTEATGVAYIDGPFLNGSFLPPKPFESWTLDEVNKTWIPPKPYPTTEPGSFPEWNESKLDWDIKEIPLTATPE
jgi:hypothetical protein